MSSWFPARVQMGSGGAVLDSVTATGRPGWQIPGGSSLYAGTTLETHLRSGCNWFSVVRKWLQNGCKWFPEVAKWLRSGCKWLSAVEKWSPGGCGMAFDRCKMVVKCFRNEISAVVKWLRRVVKWFAVGAKWFGLVLK